MFGSVAAKNIVVRLVGMVTVVGAALAAVCVTNKSFVRAQSPQTAAPTQLRLPDESAGIDGITSTLVSVFDQVDIVALGEAHGRKLDSDLRIAVVRHPDFAKKVRSIVVEFGSASEQSTLDRYIRGENVSKSQLEQVWKTTEGPASGVWESPMYEAFFAAVRDVNSKLPPDTRIRVFGGDPGPGASRIRDTAAVALLKEQVLQKHGKKPWLFMEPGTFIGPKSRETSEFQRRWKVTIPAERSWSFHWAAHSIFPLGPPSAFIPTIRSSTAL